MNSTGGLNGPDTISSIVPIIVGPTAVGKSVVAVGVAQQLTGEIISLDSRQIYRHMIIGTVQPSREEQGGIRHHLFGIRDPDEAISAGEYAHLVEKRVREILNRGKIAVVCGGSGLYYRALTRGLFKGSTTDKSVREKLRQELHEQGAAAMLDRLREVDPAYAQIVHPNNHKRLLRALEIYEITGDSPTAHFRRQKTGKNIRQFFTVYLRADLHLLECRIRKRTDEMLAKGWIEEVEALLRMGYSRNAHPMDSLGYRLIIEHLEGKLTFHEMVDRINIETRQYARKQIKWFNREPADLQINMSHQTDRQSVANRIARAYLERDSAPR